MQILKLQLKGITWPKDIIEEGFKILELNALNFGVPPGKESHRIKDAFENFFKPKRDLDSFTRLLSKHKPAMIVLIEVFDKKTMTDYDYEFLHDQYEEVLIEGNDGRGIDIGLWVRKDLPIDLEIHSHKNLIDSQTGQLVYSRDFPTYILSEKNDQFNTQNKNPFLIVEATHNKSQRGDEKDPTSSGKRTEQFEASSDITSEYEKLYPDTPIIMTGDFNIDVKKMATPELNSLKKIGMVDAFESTTDSTPLSERDTHYFFDHDGNLSKSQLDTMLINIVAYTNKIIKSAKVLFHIQPNGEDFPPPTTFKERELQPSDHRPNLFILDLEKLISSQ